MYLLIISFIVANCVLTVSIKAMMMMMAGMFRNKQNWKWLYSVDWELSRLTILTVPRSVITK